MENKKVDEVIIVDLDKVNPDPDNLREHFDERDLKALADNILEQGQMDPIQIFMRDDGVYQIFDGERRWRASKIAGLKVVKALVIPKPSKEEFISKRVSRAMQSRNLTPQEEVRALESAITLLDVSSKPNEWSKIARKLGVSPQLLRDRMRIATLQSNIRKQFEDGELDLSTAQALGRLKDPKRQAEAARFIKENQLNARFVSTKFIEKLILFPDSPILEVYTIAQSELRSPIKITSRQQKDGSLADRLEDLLADLRRANTWLETAGREELVTQLSDRQDSIGLVRLSEEVERLMMMCRSFLKHSKDKRPSDNLLLIADKLHDSEPKEGQIH
jgi:ParB/RepB/Spo0J family partition protein